MANYVQSTLINDEKVIYEAKTSLWSMVPLMAYGSFFFWVSSLANEGGATFLLASVGIAFWLRALIRYLTTELVFTNKRVTAKFGFISRKTIELNIAKVESVQVNQSPLGRVLNFGTLIISGAGNPQAPIPGISNPLTFRRAFMEFQDRSVKGEAL